MTTEKIHRASAKDELVRLNDYLETPYLLIGGLAVQQYQLSRISRDIDLICDFETIQSILDDLYPTIEWEREDRTDDEFRPAYHIKHRNGRDDEIIFGPKVTQRGDYPFMKWAEFERGARPFHWKQRELTKILVPPPHALAYSKLVSFASRRDDLRQKIAQDARDFADMTNSAGFSLSEFWNFLQRNDPNGALAHQVRARAPLYEGELRKSCIFSLSSLLTGATPMHGFRPQALSVCVYLAAPHRNVKRNADVAAALRATGVSVKVPYEEVVRAGLVESEVDAAQIRRVCIDAIDTSDTVAVDLDSYGLDTAWELGYAEGRGKRIVGFNLDLSKTSEPHTINRRHYLQNFMHGWGETLVYQDVSPLIPFCQGKIVYVCGSFGNSEISRLTKTELANRAKLIIPSKHVSAANSLPKEYPLRDRQNTNRLLASADVVLVVLPRYGMDASWQIGYATALGKPVVGIVRRDDKRELVNQSFWDHWMHGWRQKPHVVSLHQLSAFVAASPAEILAA